MKTDLTAAERESPARRLGILYVASLSAVALLSVVSQSFILRQLDRHSDIRDPILLSAGRRSVDRSLSLSALGLQATTDPRGRQQREKSLREAVAQWEKRPAVASRSVSSEAAQQAVDRLLRSAEPHRRAAMQSAKALLAELDRARPGSPSAAVVAPLVQNIVDEVEAYCRAFAEAQIQAERAEADRITKLKSLEFRLFGLMLVVLVLEGLFVISPAVHKIRHIMAEMDRSHRALESYAAKLERSNHELQDFASVASHDLQEPLRKVMAFSDRLKTKCSAALDDQGRDYLDRIQNASRRMQTLINDLLTYARVTTKAQPFVPTDLTVATKDVLADLEVRIEQVKGSVEVSELPTVDADPLQVRQLMQNLIGNALKYHRPETPPIVKIYRKLPDPQRSPSLVEADNECEIVVEDNGIGFDEAYTDRIFTIFQRLHGRTEYEGTGVGLAVCRKITERHGGRITARSTPGQGSKFLVTLPVRQKKEATTDGGH